MTTTRTIADREPGGSAAGPERATDGEARSTRARAPHPNARPGRGEGTGKKLLALPVWLLVIVCSGLPLAWMVGQIAFNSAVLTEARLDGHRWQLLARTLLYNGAAGVVSTLISLPAAIVLGRGRGFFAKVLWFVLPATLLLPSITYAYGWSQLLRMIADRNEDLRIAPASVTDVARCVLTLGAWLWPLPAAAIGLALRRLDAQVQQQSLLDGVLWRMTFRQLLAPAAAGAAIVAVLAMQEFAIYEPTGISVVATEVRMVFETGAFSSADNPITAPMGGGAVSGGLSGQQSRAAAAVATALPLLGVIVILSVLSLALLRRSHAVDEVDDGPWPRALDAPAWLTVLAWLITLVLLMVPLTSLALSLHKDFKPLVIWNEFEPQMLGSITVATITGVVALAAALWAAAARSRGAIVVAALTFLIGGQLLAVADIRLYNRRWLSLAYNGWPILVIAYLGRFAWLPLLAAGATWGKPWRTLRDMAAVDGASPVRAATDVIWPLAWPALGAAALLVAILALSEVPATVLIAPQRPQMLTPMLMTWVHMLRYDAMIEGSLLLAGAVFILGAGAVALAWFGIRLRTVQALVPMLALAVVSGCGEASKPDAIWCETGTGPAQVVYPRAICYSKADDTFWIIDRMARVQQLDRSGKCLNEWRMPDWQTGKLTGVSVGPDGNVYVPDTHYHRVIVYKPDGTEVRRWGSFGKGPGQFIYPTDVAFDDKGRVFVSEYGDNDRISVFDQQGTFLYSFGRFGQSDGEFSRPQSMVIEGDLVYVTDDCNHRIVVFKTDGTFVRNMGSVGSGLGEFRWPRGLDMDSDGNLIVCEFGNNRVQLIDKKTGRGLKTWGTGGHEPGQLAYPWATAVDKRDRVVAVDAGNNRLQVFEF